MARLPWSLAYLKLLSFLKKSKVFLTLSPDSTDNSITIELRGSVFHLLYHSGDYTCLNYHPLVYKITSSNHTTKPLPRTSIHTPTGRLHSQGVNIINYLIPSQKERPNNLNLLQNTSLFAYFFDPKTNQQNQWDPYIPQQRFLHPFS